MTLKKSGFFIYFIWSIIFIILPLMLIIGYSITTSNQSGDLNFTFSNFLRFNSPIFIKVFLNSFILAIKATIICFFLGYPAAYIISTFTIQKRNIYLFLLVVPMWMNFLLRTYALRLILGNNGIINKFLEFIGISKIGLLYNELAIIIGMVYNFLPFMILPIYSVLVKIDYSLIDAAMDLGANKKQVFLKVVFPLSIPGVISGITMVFMPAVSSFVIPNLLGGNKINLIGNIIEDQFVRVGNWHFGSSIAIILMIFILISTAFMDKYHNSNKEEIYD